MSEHRPRRGLLLCAVAALAGCASGGRPVAAPTAAPPPVATNAADPAADVNLRGRILLPAGAALPPAGRLGLRLADRFPQDADSAVLAQSELALPATAPIEFVLPYRREQVRDISVYRLEIALYDAAGRLVFVSDGEHPVNLGPEAEPTRIELMAVAATGDHDIPFDCAGETGSLHIDDPDAALALGMSRHVLKRAHAASGLRYVGSAAELWMDDARLRIQIGEARHECRRLDD